MSKKSKKKVVVTKDTSKANPESKSGTKKVSVNTKKKVTPTVSRNTKRGAVTSSRNDEMIFGRSNYILMAAGVALIALGMILMLGGWMPDNNTWDDDIIYSTRRTVLAPFCILAGLSIEVFAIFKK